MGGGPTRDGASAAPVVYEVSDSEDEDLEAGDTRCVQVKVSWALVDPPLT